MCSRGLNRILLTVFNTLFFIGGVLLLAFGIAGIADPSGVAGFIARVPGVASMAMIINIPDVIVSCAVYMIVLGSLMLVFGFLGCGGALLQSKPLLFFYWIFLIGLIAAQVALIIFAAVSPSQSQYYVQQLMITSLHKNYQPVYISPGNKTVTLPSNVVSVAWVSMQFEVQCCGVYNYTDYQNFNWNNTFQVPYGNSYQTIVAKVPPSCCDLNTGSNVPQSTADFTNLPACLKLQSNYVTVGCYKAVSDLLKEYSTIAIAICSCVIVVELGAMFAAIYLWRTDDKRAPKAA